MTEPLFDAEQNRCDCENFNADWCKEQERWYCVDCGEYQD